MPRMLTERESAAAHLTAGRRHQRLARRRRRPTLADAMEAPLQTLRAAALAHDDAIFEVRSALDIVIASDADLDDTVRDLFGDAEKADRKAEGQPILPLLFPEGGFGPIVNASIEDEPKTVEGLATRVDSLGAQHALAPYAAALRSEAKAVGEALSAHGEAVRLEKAAAAQVAIAELAVRRQYEGNYLAARTQWGRVVADRLFPRVHQSKSAAEDAPGQPGKDSEMA